MQLSDLDFHFYQKTLNQMNIQLQTHVNNHDFLSN